MGFTNCSVHSCADVVASAAECEAFLAPHWLYCVLAADSQSTLSFRIRKIKNQRVCAMSTTFARTRIPLSPSLCRCSHLSTRGSAAKLTRGTISAWSCFCFHILWIRYVHESAGDSGRFSFLGIHIFLLWLRCTAVHAGCAGANQTGRWLHTV